MVTLLESNHNSIPGHRGWASVSCRQPALRDSRTGAGLAGDDNYNCWRDSWEFELFDRSHYTVERYVDPVEVYFHRRGGIEALRSEINHLDSLAFDWAAWDDTYDFVTSLDEKYINSNLLFFTFRDSELNLVFFLDPSGAAVWAKIYDLETEEPIQIEQLPVKGFLANNPLIQHKDVQSSVAGILNTQRGPMLIASRPIVTSDLTGPIKGSFLIGKLLTEGYVRSLSE